MNNLKIHTREESVRRAMQLRKSLDNRFNTKTPWFLSDTFFSIFFGSILAIIVSIFAFQGYMMFRMAPAIMAAPDLVNKAAHTADKGLNAMDSYLDQVEKASHQE